jgi:hypothetical protein
MSLLEFAYTGAVASAIQTSNALKLPFIVFPWSTIDGLDAADFPAAALANFTRAGGSMKPRRSRARAFASERTSGSQARRLTPCRH